MSTKTDVLMILEKNRGNAVSGSRIAMSLGVSRNSVWKAINSLRKDGHVIEGGSGRGYVLARESDALSAEGISEGISKSIAADIDLHVFDLIGRNSVPGSRQFIHDQFPVGRRLVIGTGFNPAHAAF